MADTDAHQVSAPDPRGSSGAGRSGLHRAMTAGWPVLVAAALTAAVLAYLQKLPCRAGGWNIEHFQYQHGCYTDIYPLYFVEGLADGKIPYVGHPVEYPVVIGAVMQAVGWLVAPIADPVTRGETFYDITVAGMAICLVAAVLATGYVARRPRRGERFSRDALLVALSPALILAAYINWDLLAVALTALGIACWARGRLVWAGVLLGLAVATKFYPLVLFGPLFLLCLRAGRLRAFGTTAGSAAVLWVALNLPVYHFAPRGWATFYTFSQERPADWGSIWYFFQTEGVPGLGSTDLGLMNMLGTGSFAVLCLAIAALTLTARRRPRLGQLCFLVLAAFLLTNKVWSPQYVLWLLPFCVLARPRALTYGLWQIAAVGYFVAIWGYLLGITTEFGQGIGTGLYFVALLARLVTVVALCALIVRDVLAPEHDVVRVGGVDDPAGGVLDGAPDWFVLRPGGLVRKSA